MRISFSSGLTVTSLLLGASLLPATGYAHIDPLKGMKSRSDGKGVTDRTQKASPCDGPTWGMNGSYKFAPGATITIGVKESVPHPGYFRIAFDADADASFKDPVSIDPIARECLKNKFDSCGESDFCTPYDASTGAVILWDNLDPHKGAIADRTWKITLPNIECEKCTLQIIQVMEDAIHGPYNTTDDPAEIRKTDIREQIDVYHRCFDITLESGAPDNPGMTPEQTEDPNGINCSQAVVMDDGGVALPDAGVVIVDPGDNGGSSGGGTNAASGDGTGASGTGGSTSSNTGTSTNVDPATDGDGDQAAGQSGDMSSSSCSLTAPNANTGSSGLGLLLLGALGWLVRRRSA